MIARWLSVRADVERIEDALTKERLTRGSVAIISCSGNGFYEEIELPLGARPEARSSRGAGGVSRPQHGRELAQKRFRKVATALDDFAPVCMYTPIC